MELQGMKVTIRLRTEQGRLQHSYPAFNDIDFASRGGMDWSYFIDRFGIGWHYDAVSGFGDSDMESPDLGEQFAITAVPSEFAEAAKAMFPDDVQLIKELELQRFFENRAHVNNSIELVEVSVLDGLRAKYGIVGPFDATALALLTPEERRALDPEDPAPGIVNNPNKLWRNFKGKRQHTFKDREALRSPLVERATSVLKEVVEDFRDRADAARDARSPNRGR